MKFFLINPLCTQNSALSIRVLAISNALIKKNHHILLQQLEKRSLIKILFFMFEVSLKIIKETKLDYIFAFKSVFISIIPALLGKLFKKKVKIILDVDDLEHLLWHKSIIISKLLFYFEKHTINYFDIITTHNKNIYDYLIANYNVDKSKILILPQGLDIKNYETSKSANKSDNVLFVYCAYLGIASDFISFLKLWKDILKTHPHFKLTVVGEGVKLEELKKYSSTNNLDIIFLGHLPHKRALEEIARADIAINFLSDAPGDKYRSSLKLREYLLLKKNVISSYFFDSILLKDYLFLFDIKKESLLKAIDLALKTDSKNSKGHEYIVKNFNIDTVISNFLEELDKVKNE